MAPRDSAAARETVAQNFGLTADDLGVSDNDGDGLQGFDDFDSEGGEEGGGGYDGLDTQGGSDLDGPDMGEGERPTRRARDQFGREPQARRQQQSQQRQQQPMPASAEVRPDARGNLVDARGNVVARAGKEARFYQAAANATRQVQQVRAQYEARHTDISNRLQRAVQIGTELHSRLEQMNARDAEIRRLNISPQEQLEAMQMVAMSKQNPVQAIKTILTRAAANGIDLSQLGLTGGGDTASLVQMLRQEIDQRMQPLRERTEAERQEQERRQQAQQTYGQARTEVATFFAQNPEARQFAQVFDAVLQRHPDKTLGEVWAEIRLNLATRRNAQSMNGSRTRNRRGAPPNGHGWAPSTPRGTMAPVTESYESIARGVLREAGIR